MVMFRQFSLKKSPNILSHIRLNTELWGKLNPKMWASDFYVPRFYNIYKKNQCLSTFKKKVNNYCAQSAKW